MVKQIYLDSLARGQDGRFQDNQRHFGGFPIVREAFHFHHVELILGLGSQTHLEKQHSGRQFELNDHHIEAYTSTTALARVARSADARYFWRWNRFSSSQICTRLKDVRGFFLLGGVRFWYGWPMRRVTENGDSAAERESVEFDCFRKRWSHGSPMR
ncbi:hypothetical protein EYF80_031060 [Liparis tanakae]|uniref:Uncharacterized protein n=1 Tax=Liparis tanakae TaxID=230148 RepID=A0A4Z2H052_9TELE|nr:hypothetical protein EYF80_031060 [Liparis tanakae]